MAHKSIWPGLPKGLLGFSCRVWHNLSGQLIVARLDKKAFSLYIFAEASFTNDNTLQLILFASKYTGHL
jgi:hypothetical protein